MSRTVARVAQVAKTSTSTCLWSSCQSSSKLCRVNSKAQLRVPLERLLIHVPPLLHPGIRNCRYYADKSSSLLIQADESRKQGTNKETCFRKLHQLLAQIGRQVVPGETSDAQKERVKGIQRSENEARIRSKKQLSNKKTSRSKSLGD